jgi:hypothetical protein
MDFLKSYFFSIFRYNILDIRYNIRYFILKPIQYNIKYRINFRARYNTIL